MFNHYFNDHAEFTMTLKGKLPPKFMMLDIEFHGTENPHHCVTNFVSVMTLKDIGKDIIHLMFPWAINNEVMRFYNITNPQKVAK